MELYLFEREIIYHNDKGEEIDANMLVIELLKKYTFDELRFGLKEQIKNDINLYYAIESSEADYEYEELPKIKEFLSEIWIEEPKYCPAFAMAYGISFIKYNYEYLYRLDKDFTFYDKTINFLFYDNRLIILLLPFQLHLVNLDDFCLMIIYHLHIIFLHLQVLVIIIIMFHELFHIHVKHQYDKILFFHYSLVTISNNLLLL